MNKIDAIISRWADLESRPLFKGKLIDDNGCCCAQGDILRHECRMSDEALRKMSQNKADREIAKLLGVPLFQSILLRYVNDSVKGCPQDVLSNIEKFLGPNHHKVLMLMEHLRNKEWSHAEEERFYDIPFTVSYDRQNRILKALGPYIAPVISTVEEMIPGFNGRFSAYAIAEYIAFDELQKKGVPIYFLPLVGINSLDQIPF